MLGEAVQAEKLAQPRRVVPDNPSRGGELRAGLSSASVTLRPPPPPDLARRGEGGGGLFTPAPSRLTHTLQCENVLFFCLCGQFSYQLLPLLLFSPILKAVFSP